MKKAKIYYACMGESWRKEKKLAELEILGQTSNVSWQEITPDKKYTWLNKCLESDFENFIPIGNKETRSNKISPSAMFKTYTLGVVTNRDRWAYNFHCQELKKNIKLHIETYNKEIFR
jgi:predicted helicase